MRKITSEGKISTKKKIVISKHTRAKSSKRVNNRTRNSPLKKRPSHKKKKLSPKQRRKLKLRQRRKLFIELTISAVICAIFFSVVAYMTFAIPEVDGYSMTPTTNDRDRLFVNKWGKIKRMRLLYFKEPKKKEQMIRRVIGLPGDTLFYKDGRLFVNGNEVAERFLSDSLQSDDGSVIPDFTLQELLNVDRVPEGKYFLLGDNRSYATDSRFFGFVDEKDVIGVVEMRLFPIHSMTHF